MLTLFTSPKPFRGQSDLLQRNAIRSWIELGPQVEVLLVGDEPGMAEAAAALGVRQVREVERNTQGTPLVSSIFAQARAHSDRPLLAYVNADIILLPDLLEAAGIVAGLHERFLIVGRRWDLEVRQPLAFEPGWEAALRARLRAEGVLHPPGGSDVFIFPRPAFREMPPFAIGRAGWDNWMIFRARRLRWPVVDASGAATIVHQNHDYSHLPGGRPHYTLPESAENVRLAGGRRAIFGLRDADHRIRGGRLVRRLPSRRRLLREFETLPLRALGSSALAELTFALVHPLKAVGEWRGRLAYALGRRRPGGGG